MAKTLTDSLVNHDPRPRAGLASLPADIVALIANYLTIDNAKSLALTVRSLYRPARYRTLRCITVNTKVAEYGPTASWLRTLERNNWLSAVRHVIVLAPKYDFDRCRYEGDPTPSRNGDGSDLEE